MRTRTLWIVITVVGLVPAAALGYWLGSPDEPDVEPEPVVEVAPAEVTVDFPQLNLGPRPAGVWAWSELRGGECVDPYESAWAEEFVVVSCDQPHEAEFVRSTLLSTSVAAPYPGDEEIARQAEGHCASWERDDLNEPEAFDDLIAEVAYSLGEHAWERGDRLLGCFVSQRGGREFTSRFVR